MISVELIYTQLVPSTTGFTPISSCHFLKTIYQKQLNHGTKILEKWNKNLKDNEKVNIMIISKNKIEGKKNQNFPPMFFLETLKD